MPQSLFARIAFVLTVAVVGAAWGLGGGDERRGAILVGGGSAAVLLMQALTDRQDPLIALALIDGAAFIGFMALAWRSRRAWPLLAATCQGMSLSVHAIRLFSPRMSAWTYLTALAVPSYALLAILAAATWGVWRANRRGLFS